MEGRFASDGAGTRAAVAEFITMHMWYVSGRDSHSSTKP
jgi:hypothetical protein